MGMIFLRNKVSGAVADAYAIGGASPELVAAFLTTADGTTEGEYFRTGGSVDDFSMFTFSRSGLATMFDSTGTLVWAPHNLLDYSQTFDTGWTASNMTVSANSVVAPDGTTTAATLTGTENSLSRVFNVGTAGQNGSNVTLGLFVKAGTAPYMTLRLYDGAADYTVSFDTSDWSTAASSGASNIVSTALADGWQYISFDVADPGASTIIEISLQDTAGYSGDGSAGTLYVWGAHAYRSDLGGMADNPDQPAGLEKYVPTTSAAVYLPRRNAYYYNGTAWTKGGLQLESAAATQLLHGTDSFATQTETVTAQAYTLQFRGTGSITLSGAHLATLNGTGANDLVSLTFTPSAGTLTLTPLGTVNFPQLETGSTPSSYIPNTAASGTVTRAAETLSIAGADSPISATEATLAVDALLTSDGQGPEIFNITSASNWVRIYPRSTSSTYAQWRPSYTPEVTAAQGGTISAGINQPATVALGIKANDEAQLVAQGNAGTAISTTTITDFSGQDIGISGNIGEGSFFYKTIRIWSTKLPAADLVTAGTAS